MHPKPTPAITPQGIVVSVVAALSNRKDPSYFRLRRGSELLEGMLSAGFAHALQKAEQAGFTWMSFRHDNLACALLLAARVDGNHQQTLGAALQAAGFSELRFAQLLAADTPAEVFQHLQRALRFTGGRVSAYDVARTALDWTPQGADQVRKRLICQFHALPVDEPAAV